VCFFAAVRDPALFQLVEFYKQDIRALGELGHEVDLVSDPRQLRRDCDLYWVWWPTSGAPAVLAARLRSRPVILVTAISDRDTGAGFATKPLHTRLAARFSMAAADMTLATSQDTCEGLRRYRTRRIRVGRLGVDTDFYRPRGRDTDAPVSVLTVSHLTAENVRRKRILDVVRTAAIVHRDLPGARFTIAGGHEDGIAAVRNEIAQLRMQDVIDLPGRISAEEKRDAMAGATVYFQPTDYEAFGMASAEAMACGAPVLSNAVGAVAEVVGDSGVLLPRGAGPEAYAAALLSLLNDPQRSVLGAQARDRAQRLFSHHARRNVVEQALDAVRPT